MIIVVAVSKEKIDFKFTTDSPRPLVNTELRIFALNWEPSAESKNCKKFPIISGHLRVFWLQYLKSRRKMLFFDVSYVKIGKSWRNLVGEDQGSEIKVWNKSSQG